MGFQAPNYTQVPNDYFDLVMEMTQAENKILAALLRATLGYHREEIKLSIRELARLTHLDPKSVMTGAMKLEERGLIERTVGKITTVTRWRVVIDDPKLWEKIVKTVPVAQYENDTLPLKKEKKKESKEGASAKPETPAEVKLYREVVERYPPHEAYEFVVEMIGKVRVRLGREVTKEDLKPFRLSWVTKGYNRNSMSWLEWAEAGQVPKNGTWKPAHDEPKAFESIRQWQKMKQEAGDG